MLSTVAMNRVPMYPRSHPNVTRRRQSLPVPDPARQHQRPVIEPPHRPHERERIEPSGLTTRTRRQQDQIRPPPPRSPVPRAARKPTSENTSAPTSCSGPTTPAGEPTLVMTISGACRSSTARSSRIRGLDRCTIRLAHHGASVAAERMRRQPRRRVPPTVRQLAVGKAPITPFRHAATTRSMPETRNIGAAIIGRRNRLRKLRKRAHPGSDLRPHAPHAWRSTGGYTGTGLPFAPLHDAQLGADPPAVLVILQPPVGEEQRRAVGHVQRVDRLVHLVRGRRRRPAPAPPSGSSRGRKRRSSRGRTTVRRCGP